MCNCAGSDFCDPHHGHIVSGDLRIIQNKKLRSLLCKGANYREPQRANWKKITNDIKQSLSLAVTKWAASEKVQESLLMEWYNKVLNDCKVAILKLKNKFVKRSPLLPSPEFTSLVKNLQKDFVFVPTDKAGNNIAIVCKKFYIEQSMKELDIFVKRSKTKKDDKTYVLAEDNIDVIIQRHKVYLNSFNISETIPNSLPFLYWIPKMHKKPHSKQRYIAASHCCSTKPLSAVLTKCLNLVETQHRLNCKRYETQHGINPMWIINSSTKVHKQIVALNRKKECNNLRTYDFSTLYTKIPHQQLKERLRKIIHDAFQSSNHSFISVYTNSARWTDNPKDKTLSLDKFQVCELLTWLIDNIFVTFGDKIFRQLIGIPMDLIVHPC
jgi:hypothetical protein